MLDEYTGLDNQYYWVKQPKNSFYYYVVEKEKSYTDNAEKLEQYQKKYQKLNDKQLEIFHTNFTTNQQVFKANYAILDQENRDEIVKQQQNINNKYGQYIQILFITLAGVSGERVSSMHPGPVAARCISWRPCRLRAGPQNRCKAQSRMRSCKLTCHRLGPPRSKFSVLYSGARYGGRSRRGVTC